MKFGIGTVDAVSADTWQRRLICASGALVVLILFLKINGYPMFIGDSSRYSPGLDARNVGSILPRLMFSPLFSLYGDWGSTATGCLAAAYGVGQFFSVIGSRLRLSLIQCAAAAVLVTALSLMPFYATMIAAEPFSIAFFGLLLAALLRGYVNWIDLLLLVVFAGAYPAHMVVALAILIFYLAIWPKRRYALAAALAVAVIGGVVLDNVAYAWFGPDEDRISTSFLGISLLAHYPFVLNHRCARDPEFRLCEEPYRSFIARHGRPGKEGSRFLWRKTSLIGESTKIPDEYVLSIRELEDLSASLVLEFVRAAPKNMGYVVSMAGHKFAEILTDTPGNNFRSVRRTSGRAYWRSLCGSRKCNSRFMNVIYQTTFFVQVGLAALVAVLVAWLTPPAYWGRMAIFLAGAFVINMFLMTNLAVASPRYAYKIFFIVSTIWVFGLFRLAGSFRSRSPKPVK